MAKHILRKDQTCLNCRRVVSERFCPNCGQENSETRHSFHHLFLHFFEDLTHYENSFWKTIKTLLTRPGRLTSEYLSGKRMSYLAPVRLYIFVSFVTFLFMAFNFGGDETVKAPLKLNYVEADTIRASDNLSAIAKNAKQENTGPSINLGVSDKNASGFEKAVVNTIKNYKTNSKSEGYADRLKDSMVHNIPKVLFIYMPIFAFFLWLFHGKKRWFYFDHGIFTLHYFSFILLTFLLSQILEILLTKILPSSIDDLANLPGLFVFGWWIFYLFRSHRRVYLEARIISRTKVTLLILINLILFILSLLGLFYYSIVSTK